MSDGDRILTELWSIARAAGDEIMRFYKEGAEVQIKDDNSPVTEADLASEQVIISGLRRLDKEIPIITEEAFAKTPEYFHIDSEKPFWLVDPMDGTKEFLDRNGDFTVNIALIANKLPVIGVVHVPAHNITYGGVVGGFALRSMNGLAPMGIQVRSIPTQGATVVSSRSHADDEALEELLTKLDLPIAERKTVGSSLKFCQVAEGQADLYPRLGVTSEWDTAAGQAILMSAGGHVVDLKGNPLAYGKHGYKNSSFIATGQPLADQA